MAITKAKSPRIGDIVEFKTRKGLAYAQFTHLHKKPPSWGHLLRVLPGIFKTRPESFARLVEKPEQFNVFFPLAAAVRRREVTIVANEHIPERCIAFPVFRAGNEDENGHVDVWWLWDGDQEWEVGKLTKDTKRLSIQQICDTVAVIRFIVQGYTPLDEV